MQDKNKKQGLFSTQIPLITLIGVLLSLCIFTFHYASNYTNLWVKIFNIIIENGGRLVLGYVLFPIFCLLVLSCVGWLIYQVVQERKRLSRG
jgi:Na+/proline symporter